MKENNSLSFTKISLEIITNDSREIEISQIEIVICHNQNCTRDDANCNIQMPYYNII